MISCGRLRICCKRLALSAVRGTSAAANKPMHAGAGTAIRGNAGSRCTPASCFAGGCSTAARTHHTCFTRNGIAPNTRMLSTNPQSRNFSSRPIVAAAAKKKSGKKGKGGGSKGSGSSDGSQEEFVDGDISAEDEEFLMMGDDEDEFAPDEDFDGPELVTEGAAWAEAALKVAQDICKTELEGLELYAFRAIPAARILRIRIDKMEDEYGSPSLEDITSFSRAMSTGLDAALGEEEAGTIEVEVSSPGAERVLRLPGELTRFQQLPLQVEYEQEDGNMDTRVLSLLEYEEEAQATKWGLADVAFNKAGKKKGQGLNRKERDMVFEIPVASLRRVRVHIDF